MTLRVICKISTYILEVEICCCVFDVFIVEFFFFGRRGSIILFLLGVIEMRIVLFIGKIYNDYWE